MNTSNGGEGRSREGKVYTVDNRRNSERSGRKEYNKALVEFLEKNEDKLCPTCRERMKKNPLRVIDCKVVTCKEIVKDAPRTIEYLDDECREHFEQ